MWKKKSLPFHCCFPRNLILQTRQRRDWKWPLLGSLEYTESPVAHAGQWLLETGFPGEGIQVGEGAVVPLRFSTESLLSISIIPLAVSTLMCRYWKGFWEVGKFWCWCWWLSISLHWLPGHFLLSQLLLQNAESPIAWPICYGPILLGVQLY